MVNIDLDNILKKGIEKDASDVHITTGKPPMFRVSGRMLPCEGYDDLSPEETRALVEQSTTDKQYIEFKGTGDMDYSYSIPDVGRFRVNAYMQRGSCAMVFRIIGMTIPKIEDLGLPEVIRELTGVARGLILVTGPTGSGKSTTLAAMINEINANKEGHILTLEDPIEYLHKHNKSVINQREVGSDTGNFSSGLRAALREDPDVILVGEMRDLETMEIALTAAETGHLVLSTLHTNSAPKTIDRVIGAFPPHQQQQVRVQFSSVIQAIICQQLLPKSDGKGRVGAYEILIANAAIRNLIRESKISQIHSSIQTGADLKMQTMDSHLIQLYNNGVITKNTALSQAVDVGEIKKYLI